MRAGQGLEVPLLMEWAAAYLRENQVIKPRLNAELLLAHCTGRSRVDLYAYPEKSVPREMKEAFSLAVQRRASHEPLQYILGFKGFRHLDLAVDQRVLIPRPETEMLAERAIGLIKSFRGHAVAVDIGTGSGCIALSICLECPAAVVHATDICERALQVAEDNARRLGLDGALIFHAGDLLQALPRYLEKKCDFIICNPPYIKEGEFTQLPPEVREYEPYSSLVAGPLGHEVHLRLIARSPRWLAPGGWLLMEAGDGQLETLSRYAHELGYGDINVVPDLNGIPRVIEMRWNRNP